MLSYRVEGSILVIVASGTTPPEEREAVYGAIREDPMVRPRSMVMIDARESDRIGSVAAVQERAHLLVQLLGPKMGTVCAVVAPARLAVDVEYFQAASGELGVRVGIFGDEASARAWLTGFGRQSD
jgi:hypothetical protein